MIYNYSREGVNILLIKVFFAGFFLFNSIPHLAKGTTGQTHMTPFKRVSSPYLNLFWAFMNIGISLLLLGPLGFGALKGTSLYLFFLGGFVISMANAQLFGKPDSRLPWHKD